MSGLNRSWIGLRPVAVSIGVAVVTAVLTTSATSALTNDADIDHSTALDFYHRHYADVFDPVAIHRVWEHNYTDTYRKYGMKTKERFLKRYQRVVSKVEVINVVPADAGSNQFLLTNRTIYRRGNSEQKSFVVYLMCIDHTARLPIRTCPVDRVQINAVQSADLTAS